MNNFPQWLVPTELVCALADVEGGARITHHRLAGCLFRPHALVTLSHVGFVADISFENPRLAGEEQFLTSRLAVPVFENTLPDILRSAAG